MLLLDEPFRAPLRLRPAASLQVQGLQKRIDLLENRCSGAQWEHTRRGAKPSWVSIGLVRWSGFSVNLTVSIPTWSEGSLAGTPGVSVVNPKVRSKRLIEDVNINHQHELSLQCGMNQRSWSPIAGGIYIEHFSCCGIQVPQCLC